MATEVAEEEAAGSSGGLYIELLPAVPDVTARTLYKLLGSIQRTVQKRSSQLR